MNEVIGFDIAATMERGIMEGLAEANTHSRGSLYENCCGIWVVLLCRVIGPFTVATQEDSLSQSERNKLLMKACGYDSTTALEANVLEPETTVCFRGKNHSSQSLHACCRHESLSLRLFGRFDP